LIYNSPIFSGTYANDRPLVVGTVGRQSGQIRFRVVKDTKGETLLAHVHRFILAVSQVYTDEYQSYNHVIRPHAAVSYGDKEWARDDDGDGIREVHVNMAEDMWTDVRNFLRPLKGVYKKNQHGYISVYEFRRNVKRISPEFISVLVTLHSFHP
jgi:transposase